MHFEQRQISKLHKQLNAKEQEHRREKNALIQKIELLQSQIIDYQEKQSKNRQLNQSIMISYKQNQSFRQQYNHKQLSSITQKHLEELKILKKRHNDQKKRMQDQINNLKCENDKLKLDIERIHLQHEKQIAEINNNFQQKLSEKDNDMNNIFHHKLQLINQRLKQSEEINHFFKNQLQSKKEKNFIDQNQIRIDEIQNSRRLSRGTKNQQNYNLVKKSQQSISSINLRINRALVQLHPNKSKLENRIRKIKERIYQDKS